jgi:hypothetical protein
MFWRRRPVEQQGPRPRDPEPAPPSQPTALTVTDADLDPARRLADQFTRAVGSGDAALREFGQAWDECRGVTSNPNLLVTTVARDGATTLQRPSQWLVAVSRLALVRGDLLLVARLAVIAQMWTTQADPSGDRWFLDGVAVGELRPEVRAQVIFGLTCRAGGGSRPPHPIGDSYYVPSTLQCQGSLGRL